MEVRLVSQKRRHTSFVPFSQVHDHLYRGWHSSHIGVITQLNLGHNLHRNEINQTGIEHYIVKRDPPSREEAQSFTASRGATTCFRQLRPSSWRPHLPVSQRSMITSQWCTTQVANGGTIHTITCFKRTATTYHTERTACLTGGRQHVLQGHHDPPHTGTITLPQRRW